MGLDLSLSIVESDRVQTGNIRQRTRNALGAIFKLHSGAGTGLDEFSNLVTAAMLRLLPRKKGGRNLCRTFSMIMTPALPAGETKRVENLNHFVEVYVGVSNDEWNDCEYFGKREMLLDVVMATMIQYKELLEISPLKLTEAVGTLRERYQELRSPPGTATPISVGQELLPQLESGYWQTIDDRQRLRIASELVEKMNQSGRSFSAPVLSTFGSVRVAQCRDACSKKTFSLILGAKFRPGLNEYMMKNFHSMTVFEDEESPENRYPETVWPYGSSRPFELQEKPQVAVEPFWMTTTIFDKRKGNAWPDGWPWDAVLRILKMEKWVLPNSNEFEWAARGPREIIFPWGNDGYPIWGPPELDQDGNENSDMGMSWEESCKIFAAPNDNGLKSMTSFSTWCEPISDLDEPFPIVTRGGGCEAYPHQGCGEGFHFLCAMEARWPFGEMNATLRPIIRISK